MIQRPRGTRDFLPKEMRKRTKVFDSCRQVFEQYGYGEVQTPAFESLELLTRKGSLGDDAVKDVYRFTDKSDRELGLRYDLTTPLARLVVNNKQLKKPIRWYYITNMWRYEDVSKGRWREFWQAGVELIGSDSPRADSEIIKIVIDCLKSVGLEDFIIKINSREILENMAEEIGIENKQEIFRIIDKLDKQGEKKVRKELAKKLEKQQVDDIFDFINSGIEKGLEKAQPLQEILKYLSKKYRKYLEIDFSISRGLDYYTGFIFETLVKGQEDLGSICSGGRYDSLIEKYDGPKTPSTGMSIGLDRLVEVLPDKKPEKNGIFIATVGDIDVSKIEDDLRDSGKIVEVGLDRSLSKQLKYAAKKYETVLIVGEKDLANKQITLRNMKTGEEKKIAIDDLKKEI